MRDDGRLRDRLVEPDRERAVVVGMRLELSRNEQLSRHASHRVEHPFVDDPAATEELAHPRASVAGPHAVRVRMIVGATSTILSGSSSPTAIIGTIESAAVSEPCEPPPR